jgi:ABC-2 type transport system ATP-binding protein
MLCTLIEPTSGTATVAGYDLVREAPKVRREIGVVSEGVMLYRELTIEENLRFLSRLYSLPSGEAEKRIAHLLEMFRFEDRARRMVKALSSGWMKKALICAALLHNPKILFLDEVTSGLDPQSATALQDFTRGLCKDGVTVIWTTHYMTEPEKICDRIGIVFAGRLIQVGSPGDLKHKVSELSVMEVETPGLSTRQLEKIRSLEDVCNISYDDPVLRITCVHDHALAENVTRTLLSEGAKIRSINTKGPTLEEAFIKLTGGEEEIDRFLEKSRTE